MEDDSNWVTYENCGKKSIPREQSNKNERTTLAIRITNVSKIFFIIKLTSQVFKG